MTDLSLRLGLPFLAPAQAQKHVTVNEALARLDLLVQAAVTDRDRTVPPAAPQPGDRHIVAAPAGGAWAGQAGSIAEWAAEGAPGQWSFVAPRPGWRVEVLAEARSAVWNGLAWLSADMLPQRFPSVGVNADADTTNRLTVSAEATLLTHAGQGHQLKVNKAAPGDTASLLFQTAFSGRAEMGLAGDDAFSVKTSPDGAAWSTALAAPAGTGPVEMPRGLLVSGSVAGSAVTQSAADTTAGRLLKVGDYGLGSEGPLLADLNVGPLVPGVFRCNAGAANAPAGIEASVVWQGRHGPAGVGVQLLASGSAAPVLWLRRTADGGAIWGAWRRLYGEANLVGTVSQSGGVPTGAVIERGTNASGTFIRWADGTQLCTSQAFTADVTTAAGAGFRSAVQTWTFPAAFSTATGLVVTGGGQNDAGTHWTAARALSATQAEIVMHGWTSQTGRTCAATALGRWF